MSNNEQRDELARVIVFAHGEDAEVECPCEQDLEVADAIIAAGYRKPRTITTVEELDALPNWSAILDDSGDVAQKLSGWWHFPETSPVGSSKVLKYSATVTVIHEPTTEATK